MGADKDRIHQDGVLGVLSIREVEALEQSSLYLGDCLRIMETMPQNSVDMVLCDLPYGTTRNRWDVVIDLNELWSQYKRIAKDNAAIVLFGDGMFTAKLMMSNPKMWRYNLVWDKQRCCDFLNANIKPLKCHEDICVFYKDRPTFNKQYWYSTPYKLQKNGSLSDNYGSRGTAYTESKDGRRNPLTIVSFPRDHERLHPTQKPVKLLEWLIKTYSNEGDVVLDNCMGCGSTGVACSNTGRSFIGIEIDEKYYQIAEQRVKNHKCDPKSFV